MNTHLDDLRAKLRLAMSSSLRVNESGTWGRSEAMSKELALLRARFGRPLAHRNTQSVEQAILRYRRTGRLPGYRDIKYVCAGVATEFSGWCLLQDAPLLDELLRTAEVGSDRLRLRYFSCLLHSYWSFPRDDARSSQASLDGWAVLRDWLAAQQRCLAASQKLKQPWFDTLNEHANLLTSEPCARYGQELLAGAGGGMNQAFERLGVPLDSWLREEAIYAQMCAGADQEDAAFKSCIPRLVEIAIGRGPIRVSGDISKRCVALLASRYAACGSHPEIIGLRDAALGFIGNPRLNRAAWDADGLDKHGRPDSAAREMVDGWLKVRLIKDFFGLLSEDRNVDDRRLKYWLRFEPAIEDMWFGLGANAMSDNGQEYGEFRRRAKGRLIDLSGPDPKNNVFMMRIGGYLVVEFGLTDNACFVYTYTRLPAGIHGKLDSADTRVRIEIGDLKNKEKGRGLRLLHLGVWEPEFDAKICPLIGFRPPQPGEVRSVDTYSRLNFERLVSQYRLEVEDLVKRGGCLWVRTDDANPRVCESLKAWGFTYRRGKGWWKE
jgi:EH_Signature domain